MFSTELKIQISERVQQILQETHHEELPFGEINFILHIDGDEEWSWANIRNNSARDIPVPDFLVRNLST